MKFMSLILWVTQFGISAVCPICFFLLLGWWLQDAYALGGWVMLLCAVLGVLTTVGTVRSCVRAMTKEAKGLGREERPSAASNDHD